jgi:histidinol-phosphatase
MRSARASTLLELADLAAGLTLDRFLARDFPTRTKSDGSPATDIDLAVERDLRERIASRYPSHAITGEEFGSTGQSDWLWYLDPIDGTSAFVSGDPTWTTLIALAGAGEVVVGTVDCPALDRRWWASRRGGACRNAGDAWMAAS